MEPLDEPALQDLQTHYERRIEVARARGERDLMAEQLLKSIVKLQDFKRNKGATNPVGQDGEGRF